MIDFIRYMLNIGNFWNSIKLLGWWILCLLLVYVILCVIIYFIKFIYSVYLEMSYMKFVSKEQKIKYHLGIGKENESGENGNE